jgi:hypothetical protein
VRKLPNTKLYKECPQCHNWSFGQYDRYCSRCGIQLADRDEWLAGINEYARSMLIEFLENCPDAAKEADIHEIPDYATEGIRANGNILFNQSATRYILAECWNEVEIALDDWREKTGCDYPMRSIEQLHIFAVAQHAEMTWQETLEDYWGNHLDGASLIDAIERLKHGSLPA